MVKFKVLKEEIRPFVNVHSMAPKEHADFEIPIQIILEGYEQGLGVGYLENELISSLGGSGRENISGEGSDRIFIGFTKEETSNLTNIIKLIEKNLERVIKKYATEREEESKQRKESEERKRQDLEEVKEKMEKLDFN